MKKGTTGFIAGFVLGAMLFGGVAAYAAGIIANPTTSKILVDGKDVNVTAYNIEGRNYLQLRDMAAAVDFSVVWDGGGNRVLIDTGRGYDPNEQYVPEISAATATTISVMTKAGDIINTGDGDYTIKSGKTEAIENTKNLTYPYKGEPALPTMSAELQAMYPDVIIPEIAPKRFQDESYSRKNDDLNVFNAYEVRRFIDTIRIFARENAALWKDTNPATNTPNFQIRVYYDDYMSTNHHYPWQELHVRDLVMSGSAGTIFNVYVIDQYHNGNFLQTKYYIGYN